MKSRNHKNTILCFINITRINYTRSLNIQIFSYPAVGAIFEINKSSISQKLADADPAGTLDSCYGIGN